MARLQGKDLKVFWIDGSGTADISGHRRTLDISEEAEMKDTTAGNDAARNYEPLHLVLGASYTALYDGTAGTAVSYRLRAGAEGSVVFGPLGTASGAPKGSFAAVVSQHNMSVPYDDNIEVSIEFMPQTTSGWVSDYRSATW